MTLVLFEEDLAELGYLTVYAMYSRNRWIGIGFISLLVMETVTVFLGLGLTLPSSDFDPVMLLTTTSQSFVFFGQVALVTLASCLTDKDLKSICHGRTDHHPGVVCHSLRPRRVERDTHHQAHDTRRNPRVRCPFL